MSAKTKTKTQERRKREKTQRKEAQRIRYEDFKKRGLNSKSKRSQNVGNKLVRVGRHLKGPCGNAGCKRCLNINLNKFYAKLRKRESPQA